MKLKALATHCGNAWIVGESALDLSTDPHRAATVTVLHKPVASELPETLTGPTILDAPGRYRFRVASGTEQVEAVVYAFPASVRDQFMNLRRPVHGAATRTRSMCMGILNAMAAQTIGDADLDTIIAGRWPIHPSPLASLERFGL
jgi:hypothetical protein